MANASIPGITAMTNAASTAFKIMERVKGSLRGRLDWMSTQFPGHRTRILKIHLSADLPTFVLRWSELARAA